MRSRRSSARYTEAELLSIVAGSPQGYGYLRPTWTQELLALVLAQRTGVTISVATMSRLLKRHRVRLGRPKPQGYRTIETPEIQGISEPSGPKMGPVVALRTP